MERTALGSILRGLESLAPAHVLSGRPPVADGIGTLTGLSRVACGRGTSRAVPPETAAQAGATLASAARRQRNDR